MSLGLAFLNRMDLRARVRPNLTSVSQEFNVTTSCSILDELEIVYVERIKGGDIVHLDLSPGSRMPAYVTAMGRAILAHLSQEKLMALVSKMELMRHTPHTITKKEALLAELERTRNREYARNIQESKVGYANFAAPIFKGDMVEAAFGITLAYDQLEDEGFITSLLDRLLDAAKKTSITEKDNNFSNAAS